MAASVVREKYKLNLDIPSYNQISFGRKSLTFFAPKILAQGYLVTHAFVDPEVKLVARVTVKPS